MLKQASVLIQAQLWGTRLLEGKQLTFSHSIYVTPTLKGKSDGVDFIIGFKIYLDNFINSNTLILILCTRKINNIFLVTQI